MPPPRCRSRSTSLATVPTTWTCFGIAEAALFPIRRAGASAQRFHSLSELELPAVVDDALALEACEGGQAVRLGRRRRDHVSHLDPARHQRVGDQLAVA